MEVPALRVKKSLLGKIAAFLDVFFFLFAAVASLWLVWVIFRDIDDGWWAWLIFIVLLWGALAYLFLPRLHRLFTAVYVPNYFIGRSRTGEGLLGDPVNIAFNGTEDDIHRLMQAAGWTLADPLNLKSSLGIIVSTLTRRSYDQAPVSTLKLFGNKQSFAYQQEVDGNPSQRHHIRFWKCPEDWPLPGGSRHVQWMAAASFDRAVGLSLFTLQVTHKIGADIDTERNHVVDTLRQAHPGLDVQVLQDFSTAYHGVNGGGDEIITDGNLPIISVRDLPDTLPQPAFDHMQRGTSRLQEESSESLSQLAQIPRPFELYWALFLIGLQLIASAAALGQILVHHNDLSLVFTSEQLETLDADGVSPQSLYWGIVAGMVALAALRILLAWAMWAGYNGARTVLMIMEAVTVITDFLSWYNLHQRISFSTTLIPLALAILLLLTLSSSAVADYVSDKKSWRAHRRTLNHNGKATR